MIKFLLPFLCTGTILSLFQLLGKFPVSNENWKILKKGLTKGSSQILTIRTDTSSDPWALLTWKVRIIETKENNYTRVWSLFSPERVYVSLHFLSILLVKLSFCLSVFWFFIFFYLWFLVFSFSVLCFEFNVISRNT